MNFAYKSFSLLVLILVFCTSCASGQNNISDNRQIDSEEEFIKKSSAPLYQKYGSVYSVKLVYVIQDQSIHFVDGKNYPFHFDYCQEQFEPYANLVDFNECNYSSNPERKYLLATLNFFQNLSKYVIEIGSSVEMNQGEIETLYNVVKNNLKFEANLFFLLNNASGKKWQSELNIPTIDPNEIYKNQNYQAIFSSKTKGFLRFIDHHNQLDTISENSIVIVKGTPIELPIVKGIITNTFQTPLSHIQILGKNRKMTSCAVRNIWEDSSILTLNGKFVEFEVNNNNFEIKSVKFKMDNQPNRRTINLNHLLNKEELLPISEYKNWSHKYSIGNKARNFAKLYKLSQDLNFSVPEASFTIPFAWYYKHLNQSGAKTTLDSLLLTNDKAIQKRLLRKIREQIKSHPISKEKLAEIDAMILKLGKGKYKRMRFRSSTNAEDAKGFSGAGLYTSKTGILGDTSKSIEDAVRKVWASTWSEKAFFERQYFNIDQEDVMMGILVHRSFPNESVNGVAITQNLYRKNYYGYVLNCQKGDYNVVNQNDTLTAEQMIIYPKDLMNPSGEQSAYDIITYSSLSRGQLLLTEEEIANLTEVLNSIQNSFSYAGFNQSPDGIGASLDLEFKIDGANRTLYIKQVRPY